MPPRILRWRPAIAWLLILALVVLHHDFWQWNRVEPLVLGWMPVAVWYHAAYTLIAMLAMYLLSGWAWPPPPDGAQADDLLPAARRAGHKTPAKRENSKGEHR